MKRKGWKAKLNKADLAHLKECGITTKAAVERSVAHQAGEEFPCWSCVRVGEKLGVKVDLVAFKAKR